MINKILITLIISAFLPFNMYADWVSLDNNKTSSTPPKITILSDDNNSTVIKIDISGFDVTEFTSAGKTYQAIDLLTDVFSTKPGSPELPHIAEILAIPNQAGISVEVLKSSEVQIFKNITIQPARPSWYEGDAEPAYEINSKAYQSAGVFPSEFVEIGQPSVFRDFRIARVSVFPLRYIPATKELQAVSSITVRINYGHGAVVNPKTSVNKSIAPSFGKIYRSSILNYQTILDNLYDGEETGHDVMLCIMPDMFYDSFQVYAEWKRQSGTDVHVTKFSDIGANSNNPEIIKDHITDAYYNWEFPPTYVLIVGDDGIFPKKIVQYDYSFPNEDFFVEIEGDDFFPEMMIGRFTNQQDYRLQVMINKFMMYEKEPYTDDTDWFKKGICCSNNAYASQVSTKRKVAAMMMEDGGFTSVDTLMSDGEWGYGCTVNFNDIKNAINDGRSYLNYRGEGWNTGWYANCYEFQVSDVSSLNNGEQFTFVTSIGCGVAMFNSNEGNCFGEEWLELGSTTSPRGAIAFVGPTSNTHTTYNNRIDKGIYTGMFQEGMDTPGQALLRGKLYMYNVFGSDPWVEYHYRVFTILGDPSIHIWKDVPLAVNVSHAPSFPLGYSQQEFTVTFESTGQAVAHAQLCISGTDIFTTAYTDSTGKVTIGITPENLDPLTVVIRGGNVIPYDETIDISQSAEHISPEGNPVIVDIDGNTDGLINPNENCTITFTLKNWGTQTANTIEATLTTSSSDYVEIISTDPVSFGNLTSGGTFTGNPFQFHVLPDCPVGEIITLDLHITSSTSSWDYSYSETVRGCSLWFENSLVDDEGSLDRNYRMDPGETVDLYLSIINLGEDIAPNVTGILSSTDPYITIEDSEGSFGTIETSNIATNAEDHFIVSVDASCPTNYYAAYSLQLYTDGGNYPYQVIDTFSISVGVPVATDYTGPDAYGYYAYASEDTLYEHAPVYDWIEINGLGTELNVPYNQSDYTETVDLPFTFKYYGTNYSELRISSDGWVAFGNGTQTAPYNWNLPHADIVDCMVAAFWDDLYDGWWENGEIYYYSDNANHRFIIEWDGVGHHNEYVTNSEYFQIIILDPAYYTTTTGDGELIFQYKEVKKTTGNTIGIENHTQMIGLQYVFNEDYAASASVLTNEFAIKFTTKLPFISVSVNEEQGITTKPTLGQNHPNPFSSNTWIKYSIPEESNISLKIYNIKGELVRELHSGQQAAGEYVLEWNGKNGLGNQVGSGIYFCRFQTDNYSQSMKMFLLK